MGVIYKVNNNSESGEIYCLGFQFNSNLLTLEISNNERERDLKTNEKRLLYLQNFLKYLITIYLTILQL